MVTEAAMQQVKEPQAMLFTERNTDEKVRIREVTKNLMFTQESWCGD